MSQNKKQRDLKRIWPHRKGDTSSTEALIGSDEALDALKGSKSNLCDRDSDMDSVSFGDHQYESKEGFESRITLQDLQIVQLEPISISSTVAQPQQILNLKQSFTFPSSFKPATETSTQTSHISVVKLCAASGSSLNLQQQTQRPSSLPPENKALTHVQKRVEVKMIGDGLTESSKKFGNASRKPDLELSGCIPPAPVTSIQPKSSLPSRLYTPKFKCKKFYRPPSKYAIRQESTGDSSQTSTSTCEVNNKNGARAACKQSQYMMSTDGSTDGSLEACGSNNAKLCSIVDKLQNPDWEICAEGLKSFLKIATSIKWDGELGQRYIPIISRKLIEFFRSPRSNLCRTACQTAGEFFLIVKNTKRPEFDEMVDILLCKTADPNRFIQKDAIVALDKMAVSICVHHSVRAICAKGPDHKHPAVRATTARLLFIICSHLGAEAIVGADANTRTRKRVLNNLAKFLLDKNLETRRHAEKLSKILKRHKFFMEYFFKDIENGFKNPLRKILNALDAKSFA